MTQSGQGDEQQLPAVRPAHEGVVLPSDGGAPWTPGGQSAEQAAPAGGQPWGQPWGPPEGRQALPDAQAQAHGQYEPQPGPYAPPQQDQYPPQDPYQQGGQPQDPYQQHQQQPYQPQPQPYAQPLPPEAVPGMQMGAGGDADATQYIAPIPAGPGGLPPERPGQPGGDADATQYIPPVPGGAPYGIRPGPPGERQPPAEFDNLFRSEGPAGATQQMPHFDASQQRPQAYQGQHGGQHGRQQPPPAPEPYRSGLQDMQGGYEPPEQQQGHGGQRKRSSHIPLIAAVVVGCAVIGLGAGALMSGGDDTGPDDKQPVAAQSSPVGKASTNAAADPAEPQAKELDKLLADSNNSRSAVISAVEKIKSCQALDQAAADLKGAAQQRRELVTRLGGLTVDKLPDHAALTTSLTKAWQASAKADDHYAAWAGQAKDSKKVCKGGKARSTNETVRATEASAEASAAKRQASGIWNSIAEKYELTKRNPTQL